MEITKPHECGTREVKRKKKGNKEKQTFRLKITSIEFN